MNIFCLDGDPIKAANYHCDKHVVKQVLETFQMLGSAVIRHGAKPEQMPLTSKGTPLKGGYHNHPCTKWVGDSVSNYQWTCKFGIALSLEYSRRYGKSHSCHNGLLKLSSMSYLLPSGPLTDFAIAISPQQTCRQHPEFQSLDAVGKYRLYYICDKSSFARWNYSQTPNWFTKELDKVSI
jgi:hypothetical protein